MMFITGANMHIRLSKEIYSLGIVFSLDSVHMQLRLFIFVYIDGMIHIYIYTCVMLFVIDCTPKMENVVEYCYAPCSI